MSTPVVSPISYFDKDFSFYLDKSTTHYPVTYSYDIDKKDFSIPSHLDSYLYGDKNNWLLLSNSTHKVFSNSDHIVKCGGDARAWRLRNEHHYSSHHGIPTRRIVTSSGKGLLYKNMGRTITTDDVVSLGKDITDVLDSVHQLPVSNGTLVIDNPYSFIHSGVTRRLRLIGDSGGSGTGLVLTELLEELSTVLDVKVDSNDAVVCHGDAHLYNWVMNDERISLVDWESVVLCFPEWDYGSLACSSVSHGWRADIDFPDNAQFRAAVTAQALAFLSYSYQRFGESGFDNNYPKFAEVMRRFVGIEL